MIYERLPVTLLSSLAAEKKNSTNAVIAEYLLTHIHDLKDTGIKELALKCHVGTGSISRFCKDIGLSDFMELKKLLAASEFRFQTIADADDSLTRTGKWGDHVKLAIDSVVKSIDLGKVHYLCKDLNNYEHILSFGMLKAESAALNLQVDMLMQNIYISTCIAYSEQMEHIYSSDKDTLVIIFSYTGNYFNSPDIRAHLDLLRRPKIWMICSQEAELQDFVDDSIWFSSKHDQLSHPYQLEAVSSIIAQEYAAMYSQK